tara:strand:+ start:7623 stop:7961 length:339 start_codon:yes stop_codon:yes gene_type:complete
MRLSKIIVRTTKADIARRIEEGRERRADLRRRMMQRTFDAANPPPPAPPPEPLTPTGRKKRPSMDCGRRANHSAALLGYKHTPETRANMVAGAKARWARHREQQERTGHEPA